MTYAPINRLAVLRLDGDLYESAIQALDALYLRLSPGGFCIVDDYLTVKACEHAVADYRENMEYPRRSLT
jgi:O-methyltransferase